MDERLVEQMAHIERAEQKKQYLQLALELSEVQEGFPFPGITRRAYAELTAAEEKYPGYTTPIDEILAKLRAQGLRIDLGRDQVSGNVSVVPLGSRNVVQDGLLPRHLGISEHMDDRLKRLILANIEQET